MFSGGLYGGVRSFAVLMFVGGVVVEVVVIVEEVEVLLVEDDMVVGVWEFVLIDVVSEVVGSCVSSIVGVGASACTESVGCLWWLLLCIFSYCVSFWSDVCGIVGLRS